MYFDLHPDNKQVIEASLKHSGSMLFCSTAQKASSPVYLASIHPLLLNREHHNVTVTDWEAQKGDTPASTLMAPAHSYPRLCKCCIFSHFSKKAILTQYNYFLKCNLLKYKEAELSF